MNLHSAAVASAAGVRTARPQTEHARCALPHAAAKEGAEQNSNTGEHAMRSTAWHRGHTESRSTADAAPPLVASACRLLGAPGARRLAPAESVRD
jgi:hypothetical protein